MKINITIEKNTTYNFTCTWNRNMNKTPSTTQTIDLGVVVGVFPVPGRGHTDFNYQEDINSLYKIEMTSSLFLDLISKVDTNDIKTFDDIIGISIADGTEGDIKNIAINDGIVTNDNWNLTPGKDYYFINNTISDTPTYHTTKIYLGKAISDTAIKVDIKIYYYFGPTFDFIVPFSGNLISQNNSQYGGNITIDSNSARQTIIDIIYKGQRLQNSGTYYRALTKNR